MVQPTSSGDLIEARHKITISSSVKILKNIPQLYKMSAHFKVICGCGCCIFSRCIYSPLFISYNKHMKTLEEIFQKFQSTSSGEMKSIIYQNYKNYVMTHGSHVQKYQNISNSIWQMW